MKTRKGFTLVELLIVIVIIGVLTSGMLLSGRAATSSARALNIVNDLHVMKEAALLLYIDNMDRFDSGEDKFEEMDPQTALKKYLDNPERFDKRYGFAVDDEGQWYVSYALSDADGSASEIKGRLAGRARSAGLLQGAEGSKKLSGIKTYEDGGAVYMLAR